MLVSLIALLAACGQATQAPAPTTAPQPTTAPAATNTAAPAAATDTPAPAATDTAAPAATTAPAATDTAAPAASGSIKQYKGELVVSVLGANADRGTYKALVDAYKKVQPDVNVIIEGPPPGTGDYTTWLGTQLAAGNVRPDIVSGNYQPTYAKYVDLLKYRFQTNQYTGNTWDQDLNWDFFPYVDAKGRKTMVPTEAVHILWFYNKDIFDKAGVQPPKTWDELVQVSDKLKQAGYTPIASNYVYKLNQWILEIYYDQYMRTQGYLDLVRAQPGDYNYDPEKDGKYAFDANDPYIDTKFNINWSRYYAAVRDGKIKFDTPEMADMIRNLAKIFPKYASDSLFIDTTEYSQFLQQQVAMEIDGTWQLPAITRDMQNLGNLTAERAKQLGISETTKLKPFTWATFENPGMTGPLVKAPVRSIESATGVYGSVIDKNAQQTELAVDFLMFWFSKPGYQAWVNGANNDPTTPGGYGPAGPVEVKDVTVPDQYQKMMDNVKMLGNSENGLYLPMRFSIDSLDKESQNRLKDTLEGKTTPEDYAKWLQQAWTTNFDQILQKASLTKDDLDNPARDPNAK
jgi:ABC-type glycerol-3-phosphate transport system substrate-binding protein